MIATIYDPKTGRVLGVRRCSHSMPLSDPRGNVAFMPGDFSRGYYIDLETGEPQPKRTLSAEINGNMVSGLPDGAVIRRGGMELHTVTGGEVGLAVDFDEDVRIVIDHPQYHRETVRVSCTSGGKLPASAKRKVRLQQDAEGLRRRELPSADEIMAAHASGDDAAMATYREKIAAADRKFRKVARPGK